MDAILRIDLEFGLLAILLDPLVNTCRAIAVRWASKDRKLAIFLQIRIAQLQMHWLVLGMVGVAEGH